MGEYQGFEQGVCVAADRSLGCRDRTPQFLACFVKEMKFERCSNQWMLRVFYFWANPQGLICIVLDSFERVKLSDWKANGLFLSNE
jgi:hypothetical protein